MVGKQFETTDVSDKRFRVAEAVKTCGSNSVLLPLVKASIMELIMSPDMMPDGKAFRSLKTKYNDYIEAIKKLTLDKWVALEKELQKYSAIEVVVNAFITNYHRRKGVPTDNIPAIPFRERFNTYYNEQDSAKINNIITQGHHVSGENQRYANVRQHFLIYRSHFGYGCPRSGCLSCC